MNSNQLPRDVLVAAMNRLAIAQEELEAARRRATAVAEGKDWLADRLDLQQIQTACREAERRRDLYQQASDRVTKPWVLGRINALSPQWGFGCDRAIDEVLNAYHALLKHVTDAPWTALISTILRLDPALDPASTALLREILKADSAFGEVQHFLMRGPQVEQFVRDSIDAFVIAETREQQVAYEASVKKAADARSVVITQFRQRLEQRFTDARFDDFVPEGDHSLYQQLEDIKKSHERKLQEAEERKRRELQETEERKWWEQIATQPLEEIINKLDRAPAKHIHTVLGRILQLPETDPHIHDKRVHAFLKREHARLARSPAGTAPVLVAHTGFLLGQGEHEAARELLDLLPATTQSTPGAVAAYLRFVLREPTELSGTTEFDSLASEDLFLGACYYNSGPALDTLREQWEWDYERLSEALSASGGHELKDFQVGGLQPRIAELAFRSVYPRLCDPGAEPALRDLNLEVVKALARPWRLTSRPDLPSADWEAVNGREYDVKCNLFYRSKQEKLGLRGFLIKRPSGMRSFPAFLFTGSDARSCTWSYVGEYHPPVTSRPADDRVLPFDFRPPDSERFALSNLSCDPALGRRLLSNHRLRLGWQLATRTRLPQKQWPRNDTEHLLYAFIDSCVRIAADTFLEHALWRALTEATLEACGEHSRATVEAFLDRADSLIADRALPVHLPRIDGRPLLCRWVDEVLRPLVENWDRIRWPGCGRCGERAGAARLQITRMTSEGTISGMMICKGCGAELGGKVTLLTHCYKKGCGHYPLIIGRNPVCARCQGLVCDHAEDGSPRCKCCKIGCSHGQNTAEADFMEGSEEHDRGD